MPHAEKQQDDIFYIEVDQYELKQPVKLNIASGIDAQGYRIDTRAEVAQLDEDLLNYPLTLRKWRHGDQFRPLGMKNFKKLSDFFIDEKFSLKDKEDTWLLFSGDDIIWVVGHRCDDRYKITHRTQHITKIHYQR